eukprot:CAMPEP_0117677096 /NCGR_PEP_ID=MMETSP0804-20121206/16559_1 /TAXON_ID=1074897 /ORGANISM="Tetraselmis astigmatica, Strain CCMP880" /LENGTH=281 /DNA_ID=CAMNT_0005486349 /DNA_START=240 /DNA_END=1082 /DNA_ORIENTATION=-
MSVSFLTSLRTAALMSVPDAASKHGGSGRAGARKGAATLAAPPRYADWSRGRACGAPLAERVRSGPRLQCSALGAVQHGALSVYSRPVERSAAWQLPSWFEPCLRSVVSNLWRAPLLQAVYDSRGHLSVGTQFVTHAVPEHMIADPRAWPDLVLSSGDSHPKTVIMVHEVSSGDACAVTGGPRPSDICGTAAADALVRQGSIGDCDTAEEEGHHECPGTPCTKCSVTKYWGMVIQSPDGGPSGCFLLKTTQNVGAGCSCTHFSLTRICQGVPLAQQFVDAW